MNVVELKRQGWRDAPKTLRVIADDIENGSFGDVRVAGLVLLSDDVDSPRVTVFGMGPNGELLQVLAGLVLGQSVLTDEMVN